MRVAYLDLGLSSEQYGLQPTRYGGGGVVARYLKEGPDIDFVVFAPAASFDNVSPTERRDRCVALPLVIQEALRREAPLDKIIGGMEVFDIILHPHTCMSVNRGGLKAPVVQFCGFDGKAGHPANDYILLYDLSFSPHFGEKVKYVTIGKPVPAVCPEKPSMFSSADQSYVFQCSRFDDHMGGVELAKACRAAEIPCIFAGPIHHGYPLLDHVDGKPDGDGLIWYVGEIGEAEKLEYCRKARLFALLANWQMPFNQSIIEAQGQGTPIYVNRIGPFLNKYLHHGVNGFDASVLSLAEVFNLAPRIDPVACWSAAREYDVSAMLTTFKQAFREIIAEWAHP